MSEHIVCGLPLICLCFYSFQCPERTCPVGTFNSVGGNCRSVGLGRGGGTECSCTTCPAGEMIDIAIPFFSINVLSLCVHKCDDQKYVVPSIDRSCVLIHVGFAQASSTVHAYICIYILYIFICALCFHTDIYIYTYTYVFLMF